MKSEPLNDPLAPIDFEVDLLLLGYMATVYAKKAVSCPQKHWAEGLTNEALRLGNDQYRFGWTREPGKQSGTWGLAISKTVDFYNGGRDRIELWIPEMELHRVRIITVGRVTTDADV